MRKLLITAAAVAALAIPTAAMASVAVDNGVGFVGKGDVQTALGYANNNAFTNADALSAKFTIDGNATDVSIDVKCAKVNANGLGYDESTVHDIVVPLGYYAYDETVITSTPKISNGKVTGYNLTSVVTPGLAWHVNGGLITTSCPAGESFYGFWGDTPGLFRYVPRAGSGTLQVTIGTKTAALPNTPVPAPVV